METVFDYNIAPFDEETANMDLASLFWYRGDKKKAAKYADKLPPLSKLDFYRTVTHP